MKSSCASYRLMPWMRTLDDDPSLCLPLSSPAEKRVSSEERRHKERRHAQRLRRRPREAISQQLLIAGGSEVAVVTWLASMATSGRGFNGGSRPDIWNFASKDPPPLLGALFHALSRPPLSTPPSTPLSATGFIAIPLASLPSPDPVLPSSWCLISCFPSNSTLLSQGVPLFLSSLPPSLSLPVLDIEPQRSSTLPSLSFLPPFLSRPLRSQSLHPPPPPLPPAVLRSASEVMSQARDL